MNASFSIALITTFATVISVIIYRKQLHVSQKQTKILQGENEPKIIFVGISEENEEGISIYQFENLGKPVLELSVYITDEIFVSRYISQGFCQEIAMLPTGLNIRVNGRYGNSIQKSKGQNQCVNIKENSSMNLQILEKELRDRLKCSTLIWKRILVPYVDFEGNKQKSEYMLIGQDLYREDSDSYKWYEFGRENVFDYDMRFQNKNTIIDLVKEKLDQLY